MKKETFDKIVPFRLSSEKRKLVKRYVRANKDIYDSEAVFYRSAVEFYIRRFIPDHGIKTTKGKVKV